VTRDAAPSPSVERLAHELRDGPPDDPLAAELLAWLGASARFRAFTAANRDKIRKKLRQARDPDSLRDVRAELLAAYLLLGERRFSLEFEAYGAGRVGPDFSVTAGSRPFNVEVTRLRRAPDRADYSAPILAKLRQLPPSVANVLVIAIEGESATALDAGAAVRALRARADAKDEAFFAAHGFQGTRGFYDRLLRLCAVIAWAEHAPGDERAVLWTNGSARIPLPEPSARACLTCFRAGVRNVGA
jgi:hypothetical protein